MSPVQKKTRNTGCAKTKAETAKTSGMFYGMLIGICQLARRQYNVFVDKISG